MTAKLRLALSPSLQDTNAFTDWDGDHTTEMLQMHTFAKQLSTYLSARFGSSLEVRVFTGRAYGNGDWRANLIAEQADAYAWLNGASGNTLSLNLHTDAGSFSHVGYYYDGASIDSEATAKLLGLAIAPVFETTDVRHADYGATKYYFCTEMHRKHRAGLLEMGSHQNAHDERIIQTCYLDICKALGNALKSKFGLVEVVAPPPVVVVPPVVPPVTGNRIDAWLAAHPEYGTPRDGMRWTDKYGIEYVHTTATAEHHLGSLVVDKPALLKAGLPSVDAMSWD